LIQLGIAFPRSFQFSSQAASRSKAGLNCAPAQLKTGMFAFSQARLSTDYTEGKDRDIVTDI
jgi:hypothetical protein